MMEMEPDLRQLMRELEELNRRYRLGEEEAPDLPQLVRELEVLNRLYPKWEEAVRRFAREAYARLGAPGLIEMADGTWVGGVPSGEPVEVVPSACERIRALDVMVQLGLGTTDVVREQEVIDAVRARLEEDIAQEFGISLEELRTQCEALGGG